MARTNVNTQFFRKKERLLKKIKDLFTIEVTMIYSKFVIYFSVYRRIFFDFV